MRQGVRRDDKFVNPGPNSVGWTHKKPTKIPKGGEGYFARSYRMAQEDLLTARLDEERQIQELTQGRRPQLIIEGAERKLLSARQIRFSPNSKDAVRDPPWPST